MAAFVSISCIPLAFASSKRDIPSSLAVSELSDGAEFTLLAGDPIPARLWLWLWH
jgi:hypothetical protein